MSAGLRLGFGGVNADVGLLFGSDSVPLTIRLGLEPGGRTFVDDLLRKGIVYRMLRLNRPLTCQSSGLHPGGATLRALLRTLEEIRLGRAAAGLVIDGTGCAGSTAVLWEIREKIGELARTGKRTAVLVDSADTSSY